jgi:hypothetical protein
MLQPLTENECRELRERMGRSIREVVREAARVDDSAELELLGAEVIPPELLAGPAGATAELVAMIGETKGGLSLLHAISAAAPPPLSTLAADAAARLGQGPLSVAAQRVGTLVPDRAFALDADEPVTSVLVACRRPGVPGFQILGFTFEWPETDGAIKDAFATIMVAEGELERSVLEPAQGCGIEPEEISPEEAVEQVAVGARRCAEVGLGPGREAVLAINLLLRAGGRPDADELLEPLAGLPALADVLGDERSEEDAHADLELDERAVRAEVDLLDAALDAWCTGRGFDEEWHELVTYVGRTMADFRAWYADGRVAGWSAVDLGEYLLEFVPRKVGIEDSHVELFPRAVAEVFRFLSATGRLEAVAAEDLGKAALEAADRFVAAARDPSNFGLAKAMTAAMLADGVDLADEAAVQGWIGGFNALPEEERHGRIPAFARPRWSALPLPAAPNPPARPAGGKRKTAAKGRRAQRQARKRNRRS